MKRGLLYALLIMSQAIGCYDSEAKCVTGGLCIGYISCDSTGSERTSFSTNDHIYFKCSIINGTEQDIAYKVMEYHPLNRKPRLKEELFFVVCLANDGSKPVAEADSPPPNTKWIEKTLIPGDSLIQVIRYNPPKRKLDAGYYKAWFTLNYRFDTQLNMFPENNNSSLLFDIVNSKP